MEMISRDSLVKRGDALGDAVAGAVQESHEVLLRTQAQLQQGEHAIRRCHDLIRKLHAATFSG